MANSVRALKHLGLTRDVFLQRFGHSRNVVRMDKFGPIGRAVEVIGRIAQHLFPTWGKPRAP